MNETKATTQPAVKRTLHKEVEIAASVEVVWKALTDPRGLVNWFPLAARVTPGVGGKNFLSWRPECEGEAEIISWEPGKRLATPRSVRRCGMDARIARRQNHCALNSRMRPYPLGPNFELGHV